MIQRSIIRERLIGNVRHQLAVMQDAQPRFGDHLADDYGIEPPFCEYVDHLLLATLFGHQQHALLASLSMIS